MDLSVQKIRFSGYLRVFIKIFIFFVFVLGNFLNLQTGWADNGDYSRIMTWYTSGPANTHSNWPESGTQSWNQRFFKYWIPDWKLDFPKSSNMFSSSIILWYPGVLLNRFFYSAYTLSIPIMSIGERILLFFFLYMVVLWIDHRSVTPIMHLVFLALPLALLFSTSDVVAFFNSFYQETSAIVFIPFLIAIVVSGHFIKKDWRFFLIYFLACLCVTTSKTAYFYWPIISLPFILPFHEGKRKLVIWGAVGLLLTFVSVFIGLQVTKVPSHGPENQYNSIFTGTLLLSGNQQGQLETLGIPDAIDCIGKDLYATKEGGACFEKYKDVLSYNMVFRTILNEPGIFFKEMGLISQEFQNYSLQLGKYSINNSTVRQEYRLNLWSEIKKAYFPKGFGLLVCLIVFGTMILLSWGKKTFSGDLALAALLCLLGFTIDAFVQIWGDGHRDLLKHLFISNMLFDGLLVTSLSIFVSLAHDWFQTFWSAFRKRNGFI